MIYSGKRNGLSVRAIQWTGTNLKEVWDFLEEYREKFGLIGLNFSFVKDLPTNLDPYQNCPIRLTNRETHVIETIAVGSWVMRPLDTSKDNYLFLDNETFQDQFHKVALQVGKPDPVSGNISVALDKIRAATNSSSEVCLAGYSTRTSGLLMDDFSTSMPRFDDFVKPSGSICSTDTKQLVEKIQDRMRILTEAGFVVSETRTVEESIRLAAGVIILSRGREIHPMPYTVADLQRWFVRMCDPDYIAAYSSIPVTTKKFVKLSDLPEPMLQFVIRFPVTNWGTAPTDLTKSQINDLKRMGKLLYTSKTSPGDVAVAYSKAIRLKIMQQLIAAHNKYC